jgi:hypothetical protein
MPKKKPYVAKVSLTMRFPEARYWAGKTPLEVQARGAGPTLSAAISKALDLAFDDPSVKRKTPAYILVSVTVLSRWVYDDVDRPTLPLGTLRLGMPETDPSVLNGQTSMRKD